jgi:hypothetical protein
VSTFVFTGDGQEVKNEYWRGLALILQLLRQ